MISSFLWPNGDAGAAGRFDRSAANA